MATIAITANISQLDAEDLRAMRYAAKTENVLRENTGKPLLDISDRPSLKQFYETHIAFLMQAIHGTFIDRSVSDVEKETSFRDMKAEWADATPEQRNAARQSLRS